MCLEYNSKYCKELNFQLTEYLKSDIPVTSCKNIRSKQQLLIMKVQHVMLFWGSRYSLKAPTLQIIKKYVLQLITTVFLFFEIM